MSTFMVAGRTTVTGATINVAAAGIWNPHATARLRLREIWIASTTAGVSNIGLLRASARGTATNRPVVLSENISNDNASLSAFSLDLTYTVQPTYVSATAYLGRWNLPAAVGAGVIITFPDAGLAIYPGAGIALVTPQAVIFPVSDVTFVIDE